MDHLPCPSIVDESIRVPYLSGPIYDNAGFDGYPQRMGWDFEKQEFHCFFSPGGRTPQRAQAFLQSWLFFGMLSEVLGVCGIELKIDDFICDGSSQRITDVKLVDAKQSQPFVTTRDLYNYLNKLEE